MIATFKILTNYVPEVSVRHKVLALRSIIWCKTRLDEGIAHFIKFSLFVKNENRTCLLSIFKAYRTIYVKIKFVYIIQNIERESNMHFFFVFLFNTQTFNRESLSSEKDL